MTGGNLLLVDASQAKSDSESKQEASKQTDKNTDMVAPTFAALPSLNSLWDKVSDSKAIAQTRAPSGSPQPIVTSMSQAQKAVPKLLNQILSELSS